MKARGVLTLGLLGWLALPALQAAETAGEFEQICSSLRDGPNPYFGHGLVDELRQRLAAPQESAETEAAARGLLGRELMRQGKSEEAVGELERAYAQVRGENLGDSVRDAVLWHLALAHLQLAEDQNCVFRHGSDSCLLPIRSTSRHPLPEQARRAGELFLEYARLHPRNVQAAWLLNLCWELSGDEARIPESMRLPPDAMQPESAFPEWRDRAPDLLPPTADLAGGAVMEDFDGDGLLDLVSSSWDPCQPLQAYRNDGHGGFEPVAAKWGLEHQLGGLNLLQIDYDNDGRLDLLVLRGAWLLGDGRIRNSLLHNVAGEDKSMRFEDVTARAGLAQPAYPTQTAAAADVDGDGDLDLFVGNEATAASQFPSQLFENRGDGTFVDRAQSSGVQNLRYAKGVAWGDVDDDGDPDLYLSNFGPNRLFRNDGDWHFTEVTAEAGVAAPEVESFATWFFDFDNDGDLDLFVADYRSQAAQVTASYFGVPASQGQPLLYRNDTRAGGRIRFTEVSRSVGIVRPAMPMGANWGDLDNDGWPDLYLGTGEPDLASLMPNQMYRNVGGRFVEVTFAGRFAHLQKGHGVAFGDLDNDGDQDLFHQLGGFYPGDSFANALFENPLLGSGAVGDPKRAHWVTLRLVGRRANRFGVGARIQARVREGSERRDIFLLAGSGGSFGASSLQQELGLGAADALEELIVRWPGSGTVQQFTAVPLDRFYQVVEGEPALRPLDVRAFALGTAGGGHPH